MMLKKEQSHVVILGGGFGGLAAARALNVPGVRITLIDRSNHHLFQPLLYQVATAALAAPDISTPIRKLLWRQRNVTVLMAGVQRIDVEKKRILVEGRHIDYDYLILATGMTHAYFGNDKWTAHAPGLKTIGEALDVRRRILRAFEAAEMETSQDDRRPWTTFVVIGAGPTGVELAGALAEIAGRTLARDFRRFDPRATRVILIEAGPRILPTFSENLSRKAQAQLEHLGIEVRTNTRVTDLGHDFVEIGAEYIATRTVLWAAGVRASPLTPHLGVALDRAGRVWVEDDLSVPDRPEIFVVGDLIAKTQDGKPLPGVAQLAIQSGRHAARNIARALGRQPRLPFRYVDKGSMATIGRNKAVAQLGRFEFSGIFAWWLWLTVHVLSLVGFRSRVSVLIEWAIAYFTWQRGSRVILEIPREAAPSETPPEGGRIIRVDEAAPLPDVLPRAAEPTPRSREASSHH
jgi:NADH dehydrogenase